jgi:HEAT repeat protein
VGQEDSAGADTTSRITGLLGSLHSADKPVRARAAADLAAIGSPAVDPLIATLRDTLWEVRYRAVEALGQIRDPRVCRALTGVLKDPRDHVRYMAAKGLGQQRCTGAVEELCRALADENEYVRRISAWSLGTIGDPGALPALRERMGNETSSSVRDAITQACRQLEEIPRN